MRIPQVRLLKRLAKREGNSTEKTQSTRVFSPWKYMVAHYLKALIHVAISRFEREKERVMDLKRKKKNKDTNINRASNGSGKNKEKEVWNDNEWESAMTGIAQWEWERYKEFTREREREGMLCWFILIFWICVLCLFSKLKKSVNALLVPKPINTCYFRPFRQSTNGNSWGGYWKN